VGQTEEETNSNSACSMAQKEMLTKQTENREHIQETQTAKKATSTHTEIITTSMLIPLCESKKHH